jgi:STE24 endopeptidase
MEWFALLVLVLILAKCGAELWLEHLNRKHVLAHAKAIPTAFQAVMDPPTYARAVDYTLAKGKLTRVELCFSAVLLMAMLYGGLLPWGFGKVAAAFGTAPWAMTSYLFLVGIAFSVAGLWLEWYQQFRLEERFGFNTTSQKLWWLDRLKGLLLALVLGWPVLWLILKFVEWTGAWWWLWAWAALMFFQLLMMVLAPVVIMPIFNKFNPLPPGPLRDRLLQLAERTRFRAQSIQLMDGSKRSRHSNAFFTGFGRFRKIVLFDTLVQQLAEPELEAVLAHEIGHYKKKHIPKTLAVSALGSLLAFLIVAWLARQPWLYHAFGFDQGSIVPALLLFGLLGGLVGFWFLPLTHQWSRRWEYEADAFAAETMRECRSLVGALRKLTEKNLSNLTPHPIYSGFYYSHPTLLERESALASLKLSQGETTSPAGGGSCTTQTQFSPPN